LLEDYLQCLNCKKTRSRYDLFYDVQLVIRNCSSIEEALDKYCEGNLKKQK